MKQMKPLIFGYLILMVSMLLQFQVIWPAEAVLLSHWSEGPASLLFLPHGIKALLIVLVGPIAVFPIALAHLTTDILIGVDAGRILFSAFVSSVVMLIPMLMFNYVSQRPLLSGVMGSGFSLPQMTRLTFSVGLIAALLNALANAAWFSESGITLLAFRYLTGDLLGIFVALLLWSLLSRIAHRVSD